MTRYYYCDKCRIYTNRIVGAIGQMLFFVSYPRIIPCKQCGGDAKHISNG